MNRNIANNSFSFRWIIIIFLFFNAACENKQAPIQHLDESKRAVEEYALALAKIERSDPSGLIKLYEIATNDMIYTVEYSEVAQESIQEYLFKEPKLWVQAFSKVDQVGFRKFFSSVGFSSYPEGIHSDKQYQIILLEKLSAMKWQDEKEEELVNYVKGICSPRSLD